MIRAILKTDEKHHNFQFGFKTPNVFENPPFAYISVMS